MSHLYHLTLYPLFDIYVVFLQIQQNASSGATNRSTAENIENTILRINNAAIQKLKGTYMW